MNTWPTLPLTLLAWIIVQALIGWAFAMAAIATPMLFGAPGSPGSTRSTRNAGLWFFVAFAVAIPVSCLGGSLGAAISWLLHGPSSAWPIMQASRNLSLICLGLAFATGWAIGPRKSLGT